MTVRCTIPRASSSFIRSESSRRESSGIACALSERRSGPSIRTRRIAPAQRRPSKPPASWYREQQLLRAASAMPRARSSVEEWWCTAIRDAQLNALGGPELPGGLRSPVYGDVSRDVDHGREALQ